ncbi:MAG: hypothetical protein GX660_24415, partial [Clostridiaceae bacterium]|nr:hypothetical protein [Clostridiaceae bacterium]
MINEKYKGKYFWLFKEENDVDNVRKICTFCGEDIAADFKRCPYCGSLLDTKPPFPENEEIKQEDVQNAGYGFEFGSQSAKPDFNEPGDTNNENISDKDPLGDHNFVEPELYIEKGPDIQEVNTDDSEIVNSKA